MVTNDGVIVESPFVSNPKRKLSKGVETGETQYVDRQIYLEFVQTGLDADNKAIGSVQPVVKETYTDIFELINSHAKECGVKNLLAIYARTGDESLFNQRPMLPDGDYTSIPNESPEEIYNRLPDELKAGRTYEEFLRTLTPEQFKAFVASLSSKEVVKEDNKDGE